jgi:thioredoxin reductase (NADPH)
MSIETLLVAAAIETDVLIIGGGPVGLFQVFELGLLDLHAHVVDSMPQVGGQCTELYPDKPIYDIPALPVCGARELIERLQQQIAPFKPTFHLGQQVIAVQEQDNGRYFVQTSAGTAFSTRAIVIAAGLGAFMPRKLNVAGAEALEDQQLFYRVRDPQRFAGRELVIAGGGDSALDWALSLVDIAASIVLVHRSSDFKAAPASVRRMQQLCEEMRMQFLEGEVAGLDLADGKLRAVQVHSRDGLTRRVETEDLLVFFGLHPKLGPIAQWGLELQRNQLVVETAGFRTSKPGIHAVGDINTYPGKKKLILSGFHEAALAAFAIREYLSPGEKVHLQYTTTSPKMHQRLGVATDPEFVLERA